MNHSKSGHVRISDPHCISRQVSTRFSSCYWLSQHWRQHEHLKIKKVTGTSNLWSLWIRPLDSSSVAAGSSRSSSFWKFALSFSVNTVGIRNLDVSWFRMVESRTVHKWHSKTEHICLRWCFWQPSCTDHLKSGLFGSHLEFTIWNMNLLAAILYLPF